MNAELGTIRRICALRMLSLAAGGAVGLTVADLIIPRFWIMLTTAHQVRPYLIVLGYACLSFSAAVGLVLADGLVAGRQVILRRLRVALVVCAGCLVSVPVAALISVLPARWLSPGSGIAQVLLGIVYVAVPLLFTISPGMGLGYALGGRKRAWRMGIGAALGSIAGLFAGANLFGNYNLLEPLTLSIVGLGLGLGAAYMDMDDWLYEWRKAHT